MKKAFLAAALLLILGLTGCASAAVLAAQAWKYTATTPTQ